MKRWVYVVLFLLAAVAPAHADTLVITNTFSTGATINAAEFNANFTDIKNIVNGNLDGDNIQDNTIATADLQSGAVTTTEILDGTISTADLKDVNVTAAKLATDAVATAKILDANVTTAKLATNAAQILYEVEEGSWSSGVCTGTAVPAARPSGDPRNSSLDQAVTAGSTNERVLVNLTVDVDCSASCSSATLYFASCGYDTTDDAAVVGTQANFSGTVRATLSYQNLYTPPDTSAHTYYCVVWKSGGSATADYCARMVIQHIKR